MIKNSENDFTPDGVHFVERISNLISKTKLSEVTGIPASTMRGWKKRNCQPSGEDIYKIAKYLNVSTDYLIAGRELEFTPKISKLINVLEMISEDELDEIIVLAKFMFERKVKKSL